MNSNHFAPSIRLLFVWTLIAAFLPVSVPALTLELQRRDPATGAIKIQKEEADPKRVGVIAVDVWNFHWCKTATMRVDAFVPRMNKALEAARALGMTVMLCPSDVVENYAGYPQREAIFALPRVTVPKVMEVTCPQVPDAGCYDRAPGATERSHQFPPSRPGEGRPFVSRRCLRMAACS